MTAQPDTTGRRAASADMPFFERYLSLWVALCIVVGILLGRFLPGVFDTLGAVEVARVNLPVAVLIWLMILPMLLKIDFNSLKDVRQHWKGVGVTLFINWGVKHHSRWPCSRGFLSAICSLAGCRWNNWTATLPD